MSEMIQNPIEEEEIEERTPFVVDDDQKAEWCLQKIKEKKEELERWKAHYEMLFERVRKTIESDIIYFEGSLKGYFLQQMDEGFTKTTKTQINYALPSGKLVLKHQEPEYEKDEDKMVEWLEKNNPDLVKVKKSPDWAGMKKTYSFSENKMVTIDEDGVITEIPGVTAIPREDIFKVEVK